MTWLLAVLAAVGFLAPVQEDDPGWDWRTMGNHRRGPDSLVFDGCGARMAEAWPAGTCAVVVSGPR